MRRGTNQLLGGLAAGVGLAVTTALCLAGLRSGLVQMGTNNPTAAFEGAVLTALSAVGLTVAAWAALTLLLSAGTWLFPQATGLARLLEDVGLPWLKQLGRQAGLSAAAGGIGIALAVSPGLATASVPPPGSLPTAGSTIDPQAPVPALGSEQWTIDSLPTTHQVPADDTAPRGVAQPVTPVATAKPTAAPADPAFPADPADPAFPAAPADPAPGLADPASALDAAQMPAPTPSASPSRATSQPGQREPQPEMSPSAFGWPVAQTESTGPLPGWLGAEAESRPQATTWPVPVPSSVSASAADLPAWVGQESQAHLFAAPSTSAAISPEAAPDLANSCEEAELPSLNWPAPQGPAIPVSQSTPAPPSHSHLPIAQARPALPHPTPAPAPPSLPNTVIAPIGSHGRTGLAAQPALPSSPLAVATTSPAPAAGATPAPGLANQPSPALRVHLVAPGESLWSICASLMPGASEAQIDEAWRALYSLNQAEIGSDPNLILPGQHLVIPDGVLP